MVNNSSKFEFESVKHLGFHVTVFNRNNKVIDVLSPKKSFSFYGNNVDLFCSILRTLGEGNSRFCCRIPQTDNKCGLRLCDGVCLCL